MKPRNKSYTEEQFNWELIGTAGARTSWSVLDQKGTLLAPLAGSPAKSRIQLQPPGGTTSAYARLVVKLTDL